MADAGKRTPIAGKDMRDVIAQVNKGNMNLRPVAGTKVKPPMGQKPSPNEQTDTVNDMTKLLRKSTSDKPEGSANPAAPEAINPFKVALKPVARPSGAGVTTRNAVNQKSATESEKPVTPNNDETPETPKISTSIANKSKMFETQQKRQDGDTESTTTVGGGGAGTKPKFPVNSNFLNSPVVPKTQTKPAPVAESTLKLNGTTTPSSNKWNNAGSKPYESKTEDKKPDSKKEFPFRKGIQEDEAKTGDDSEADDKVGNTNFATMRPLKSAAKPSLPATSNTLPKQPKKVPSTINKATKEPEPETEDDDQPKLPPKPSDKVKQPKVPATSKEDVVEQPKIPPRSTDKGEPQKIPSRSTDKGEQQKIPAKTAEDIDQPKIPQRREQKMPEESASNKMASKQPPTANRKADEAKTKQVPDRNDQNANKAGGHPADSLLRNKGRPLPKPAEKQYRLLPVPKQKGKPPRKMAKPPTMDLSKFASYATPKSVQPAASQVSVDSYGDGDDLYEDCDNMEVVTRQSSRISEYTEEEEAQMEKAKPKQKQATNTDNYGKMFNAPTTVDEYDDDDEIYQEID